MKHRLLSHIDLVKKKKKKWQWSNLREASLLKSHYSARNTPNLSVGSNSSISFDSNNAKFRHRLNTLAAQLYVQNEIVLSTNNRNTPSERDYCFEECDNASFRNNLIALSNTFAGRSGDTFANRTDATHPTRKLSSRTLARLFRATIANRPSCAIVLSHV